MNVYLQSSALYLKSTIQICGSKSESNRLLLLQAIYPGLEIENLSDSEDTALLQKALLSEESTIDIHHAGTAMRFLTAYFAVQNGREVVLTGSERMKQRPVGPIVEALRELGAQIEYLEEEGFPPLKITGKKITKSKVSIDASISSQFITALLLIAPSLKNGLEITLQGKITSLPYLQMTLALLSQIGVETVTNGNKIQVGNLKNSTPPSLLKIEVESDWSSASYFYSLVALSPIRTEMTLSNFKQNSLQGDVAVVEIYKNFGVQTVFQKNSILLKKTTNPTPENVNLALNNTPDIAQTIAVTCFGLGLPCHLTGLHTLKIKETDRLFALKTELQKIGAQVEIDIDSFKLMEPSKDFLDKDSEKDIFINSYNDHRMAMAFAPLALIKPLVIENSAVVDKSYPEFWSDLQKAGLSIIIQ